MKSPIRVVCLGGGWVAIYLARALSSAIKKGLVELTVVSARADQLVMSCRIPGKVQAVSRLSPCH